MTQELARHIHTKAAQEYATATIDRDGYFTIATTEQYKRGDFIDSAIRLEGYKLVVLGESNWSEYYRQFEVHYGFPINESLKESVLGCYSYVYKVTIE